MKRGLANMVCVGERGVCVGEGGVCVGEGGLCGRGGSVWERGVKRGEKRRCVCWLVWFMRFGGKHTREGCVRCVCQKETKMAAATRKETGGGGGRVYQSGGMRGMRRAWRSVRVG